MYSDDAVSPSVSSSALEGGGGPDHLARTIAFHKSGSVMFSKASANMEAAVSALAQNGSIRVAPWVDEAVAQVGFANAMNGVDFSQPHTSDTKYESNYGYPRMPIPAKWSRYVSSYRNPFEMAVSSLSYDVESPESYTHYRFGTLAKCEVDGHYGEYAKNAKGDLGTGYLFCSSTVEVGRLATGELKEVLPPPGEWEWGAYLTKLEAEDEDAALVAAAIFIRAQSVIPELELRMYTKENRSDLPMACENDFDDSNATECVNIWRNLVAALVQPAPRDSSGRVTGLPTLAGYEASSYGMDRLVETVSFAASRSCPAIDESSDSHGTSSSNETKKSDRVVRLRRLDKEHLHGSLAAIEAKLGCPLSERYN